MTLSVNNKLILLVVLAAGGIAVLTMVSRTETQNVYASASYATDHTVPAINLLDGVTELVESERANFWQSLVQSDDTQAAMLQNAIKDARPNIAAAFTQYEALLTGDKDRALLADDRTASRAYDQLIDEALAMVAQSKKNEARDLVSSNQSVFDAIIDTVEAHRRYNKELGDSAGTDGRRLKGLAFRFEVAIAVLTCIFLFGIAFVVIRSITRALAHSMQVLSAIEHGNYDSRVHIAVNDEFGRMLTSLAAVQRSLKDRAQRDRERAEVDQQRAKEERVSAAENARIRNALDKVSVGVMLADHEGMIIYVNEAMQSLLRSRFASPLLMGASLDVLQMPGVERDVLAALTTGSTIDYKRGGADLRVVANPVLDGGGNRVGTVLQWYDRTQEVEIEEEVKQTVAQAIAGNLDVRIDEANKEGFFKSLTDGMNSLIGNMGEVLRTIATAATEVRSGADEISRGNLELSARTEHQASSLEQTAASLEEMTAAVKSNADNAAQASQLALAARKDADRGGAVVQSAVLAMNEISASSKKIADIIGVIDGIAFQTNLLALNAAVEAARAGDQGRGFAVVASEVRNLASRSAAAAKEIKGLIQDSVVKVGDGTQLVGASGQVLKEIVAGVKKVTDVVAEIAASSREQAKGIEQVNEAVVSIDQATQQNVALVDKASAATEALTEQASKLAGIIARYKGVPEIGTPPMIRRRA